MGDDLRSSGFVKTYLMGNLNACSGELILIYTRKLNYERNARLNIEAQLTKLLREEFKN